MTANSNITIIGDLICKSKKVDVKCNICGRKWSALPQALIAGRGCKVCANKTKRRFQKKKTHEEFVNEMRLISPSIIFLTKYTTAKDYIECKCSTCGNEWSARPYNLLTGYGCPQCANISASKKQLKTTESFINDVKNINPFITIVGEYTGNKKNVECECNKCGFHWYAMPINLLRKDGSATSCPRCRSSHGEQQVARYLQDNDVNYIAQAKFNDLVGVGGRKLSYDFFIPESNILIEYHGEYHDHTAKIQSDEQFVIQSEHDTRKKMYAIEHGIKLFIIWYYENIKEKMQEILCEILNPVTTIAS